MFCPKCGKKIKEEDVFCKYCGTRIDEEKQEVVEATEVITKTSEPEVKEEKNSLRTASIVLGIIALVGNLFIIFSFISILLAVIGLILAICATKKGRNVAGIVLNSISIVLSILLISFMIRVVRMIPQMIKNSFNTGNNIIEKYNGSDFNFNDIIEGFNNGDFDLNDIISGFSNGDFDFGSFPDEFDDFNLDDFNFDRKQPESSKDNTF